MAEQLVRFYDVDDHEEVEVARLYLSVLPPVGTEVRIRGPKQEGCIGETDVITTKWTVDHHYWHITRAWVRLDGIAHGWRHLLTAFVYLRRVEE